MFCPVNGIEKDMTFRNVRKVSFAHKVQARSGTECAKPNALLTLRCENERISFGQVD